MSGWQISGDHRRQRPGRRCCWRWPTCSPPGSATSSSRRRPASAGITDELIPTLQGVTVSVDHVNDQLVRVDAITGNVESVTTNVSGLTSVFAATLGGPAIKVAAFSYGVRKALGGRDADGPRSSKRGQGRALQGRDQGGARGQEEGLIAVRRLFWISVGASVGVLVVRKLQQTADALTPVRRRRRRCAAGMADLAEAVRDFGDEVQVAMLERETELRDALGLDDDGVATKPQRPPRPAPTRRPVMQSAEINRRFLAFFESRGHTVVPSSSLISDDPTLLLVPAGMVPLKPYFLLEQTPPWKRATSIQKCVRTPDIDVVGTTTRHLTFFQMAGNFSFGDYFKADAIPMAWELLTSQVEDGGFGFDPERLWATVYLDDDEAFALWTDVVGLPPERVQRRGMEDNYWSMGVPGPCGPCSEIYFDRGPEYGKEGGPVADEDRYLEVWNLVFMQYERGAGSAARTTSRSSASCRPRTSTPAWASSGWPCCCRASTTSTRPTCCARSSTWPAG